MPETYKRKQKFSKMVLDSMLEDIKLSYEEGVNLYDAIREVKKLYAEEIGTLEDGPIWISK